MRKTNKLFQLIREFVRCFGFSLSSSYFLVRAAASLRQPFRHGWANHQFFIAFQRIRNTVNAVPIVPSSNPEQIFCIRRFKFRTCVICTIVCGLWNWWHQGRDNKVLHRSFRFRNFCSSFVALSRRGRFAIKRAAQRAGKLSRRSAYQ